MFVRLWIIVLALISENAASTEAIHLFASREACDLRVSFLIDSAVRSLYFKEGLAHYIESALCSRARSLQGLQIVGRINARALRAHPKVFLQTLDSKAGCRRSLCQAQQYNVGRSHR